MLNVTSCKYRKEKRLGPFEKIITAFYSLVIFRNLQNDKVLIKFFQLLESLTGDSLEQVKKYSSFVSELFNSGYNFTDFRNHQAVSAVSQQFKNPNKAINGLHFFLQFPLIGNRFR